MTASPDPIPLRDHRACLERYLGGITFPSTSVAGRIIEERSPAQYVRDPVRPCLVMWACAAGNGDLADALPVAAAFDLFDRFLLLHDELSTDSPSTVSRWGLGQSLNAGDALYAMAFRALASDVRNPSRRLEVARLVGQAVLEAIEAHGDDPARGAPLTAAALEAGAMLAGAAEPSVRAFARAGRLLGTAALSQGAELAQRFAVRAVAALNGSAAPADLDAFEEIARYVALRAA